MINFPISRNNSINIRFISYYKKLRVHVAVTFMYILRTLDTIQSSIPREKESHGCIIREYIGVAGSRKSKRDKIQFIEARN